MFLKIINIKNAVLSDLTKMFESEEDYMEEEDSVLEEDKANNLLEHDEISPEEEGFMEGFEKY